MDSLDVSDSRSPGNSFLPVALALAGILLGSVALYFSVSKQAKPSDPNFSLEIDERIEELSLRIEALSAENQALKNGLARVVEQTQTALTQVGREIASIHQQHAASRESMGKLAQAVRPQNDTKKSADPILSSNGAALVKPANASPNGVAPLAPSKISGTYYTIQPGDTLTKVARRYAIPLQSLLDANPNINPKTLRIGQTILIPKIASA